MRWIKNIVLTFFSMLILASTFSFTVHKHYCLSSLKDVSIFTPASGCGMEDLQYSSKSSCEKVIASCCNDVEEFIEGQTDLKLSQAVDFDHYVNALTLVPDSVQFNNVHHYSQEIPEISEDPPTLSFHPFFISYQHFIV